MRLNNEKLSVVVMRVRMLGNESTQSRHQSGNRLRVIVELNGDDPSKGLWRIRHDIGEIAVQGHKDALELLRFRNDIRVRCSSGKMIT